MKTKNWYKGLTATAITLAMAGAALTVPAMAIDYDLNYGDVHVGTNDDGSVWSGQTQDGKNYFHYEQTGNNGEYDFISGKYQHTNSDGQTDTEINISQGFVDSMTDNNTETETAPDDGAEFDQVAVPDAGSETTNNTVTVSGDLTGKDTDETNDVDITISDVNVDIDAKKDFITVENGTTANITIEHSTVETEGSVVDIGSGSDVTLNLNGETTVDENGTEVGGSNEFTSFNGITVDGADLTINHDGINNFTGTDETVSENNRFEWTGIYLTNGADVNIIGADADAELTISNYENNIAVNSQKETNLDISIGTVNLTDASGDKSGFSGNGIFITHANGDFNLSISGKQTGVDENGEKVFDTHFNANDNDNGAGIYYAVQSGAVNNSITVTNTDFSVSDNGWVGMYLETSSGKNTYTFDNSYVHINSNVSNGITGQGNTNLVITNESVVHIDNNGGNGTNNTNARVEGNSYFSVSNNGSHGFSNGSFDMYNSTGIFSGNKHYGLNITKKNNEGQKTQIINSSLYASNNGWNDAAWTTNVYKAGIDFAVGAQIKNSIVIADNNATGVSKVNGTTPDTNIIIRYDVDVWDSYVHATGAKSAITLYNTSAAPAFLNVNPSSVITLQGNQYDLFDDWNSGAGHTGRTVVSGGSLQGALDNMHSFYININTDTKLTEEQLADMSPLELYMYICQNYGKDINAAIDSVYIPGVANQYEYAGPVNSEGTILFRFDLNGEVDKGAALTYNAEDNTYTFTYTDPNTGKVVEYTFRYNTDGEDLTGTGNNAYVWTPVTIINYDPLNNDLSGSQIGTAHNNDDNTATDVTIFGTTINLGEKDMPSYETKVDTQVTTTTGADGSIITTTTTTTSTYGWWVHVDEEGKLQVITPPAKDASQEEWDAFYALLNYQVTEETNLLELCGDRKLAESITVYGMWTTTTEQHVETTPAEPEIPDPPYIPDYPELPDYDPPEVDIEEPDVPLVEEPEEPTEEIDDEETPLTPSIPDEVVDDIIAEIEDEVTPLASVPKTGAEMPAATAALPAGVLAAAVAAMVRKIRRKG